MLMNIFSSLSCRYPAEIDFRGEWGFFYPGSNILDSIWYQDPGATVCVYTHIMSSILTSKLRLAIRYQLRAHGSKITTEEVQIIDNKRNRLQGLINTFEQQADSFLLHHAHFDDASVSYLGAYDEYDNVDYVEGSGSDEAGQSGPSALDGSGMESTNPEDLPILLPSSLGWNWCNTHSSQSLASKEAQLRLAQANESIHKIRLALGFKSALFRSQVRPANTQQTKTRAWNAVHSVDTTVHEHARIYSMARDTYQTIRRAYVNGLDLPQLRPQDLQVATLVLGSEQAGQRNTQQSWIWSFGQTTENVGSWMDDCEPLYC